MEEFGLEVIIIIETLTRKIFDQSEEFSKTLLYLNTVRKRLVEEGGLTELSLEFPIIQEESMSHVGITYIDVKSWAQDYANHKVQKLCISLLDDFGKPLPLESILPTLLHEFAHCITKAEMMQGHNDKGKKSRKWFHIQHTDSFYRNFIKILRIAEKLMIYSLPGDPLVKYSLSNIMRFDSVDSYSEEVIEQGLVEFMDQYQESVEIMRKKNLRINLTNNGQTKVLCIEDIDTMSLEDILILAGKKFKGKFKKIAFSSGQELKQEDIKLIKQGDVLILSK